MNRSELERFRAGDPELFRTLVDELSPRLLAVTRSFAGDADEAEELLQQVWVRAYRKRTAYSGSGSLTAWLHTLCRNVCLDERRKRRRPAEPDGQERWTASEAASSDAQPSLTAERAALSAAVRRAVLSLPDRQRDTVILRMLEGRTTRETARALGCAEGTVKAALHQALKKLKPHLQEWKP